MTRYIISFCILFVFCANTVGYIELPGIRFLENKAYDFRLNVTRPNKPDPRVVILDIDEKSLKELGRWPWDRNLMAQIMDTLFDDYSIQVLGLDILFAEPDKSSGLDVLQQLAEGALHDDKPFKQFLDNFSDTLNFDQLFASSLKNRDIVTGFFFRNQTDEQSTSLNIGKLPPPLVVENQTGNTSSLTSATGYGANLPLFQNAAADGGFIDNPSISPDGIIRKVPLIQKYKGKIYQSLALGVTRALYGYPPIKLNYSNGKLTGISMQDTFIPTTTKGEVYVPYRGNFPSYHYISVSDLLAKKVKPEILDGAVVLMGTTATGLLDMRATPVNNVFPGVEIHANIISGIIDHTIKHVPFDFKGISLFLHLIIGLILIFSLPKLKVFSGISLTLLLLVSMMGLNYYFWQKMQIIMPVVSILLFISINFVLHILYGYFVEDRNKRKLTGLFGQYIPPELVEEMSHSKDKISLKGETRELSILFSDIRDFTSLSEQLNPEQLTRLMNQYLTEMTEIILRNRGTIDKYIGDAIMAFWGAPVKDENHAKNAVQAAVEMKAALTDINKKFREQGFPEINIGVGINTGRVNVGNMGSEFRMAYTVLGDDVNLASRLESITKQYKENLIVSENTKNEALDWVYQEIDLVRVVGKKIPISIFKPVARLSTLDEKQQKEIYLFKMVVNLYRQQNWSEAREILKNLIELSSTTYLYQLYLDRIAAYELNPPGKTWDGVFEAIIK